MAAGCVQSENPKLDFSYLPLKVELGRLGLPWEHDRPVSTCEPSTPRVLSKHGGRYLPHETLHRGHKNPIQPHHPHICTIQTSSHSKLFLLPGLTTTFMLFPRSGMYFSPPSHFSFKAFKKDVSSSRKPSQIPRSQYLLSEIPYHTTSMR